MSQIKKIFDEKEENKRKKLEGYRKMLENEDRFDTNCPNCGNALSFDDTKKEQCIHCGYSLPWKVED